MNKQLSIIIAVFATIAFASCEKTINVNTPPYARKLAVNCNTVVGQPLYVVVGTSAAIKDRKYSPELLVKNAQVKLYVNDVFAENLVFDTYFGYPSSLATEPGKKYSVKISATSYDNVEASSVAPSEVVISSIVRTPNARKDDEGALQDAVVITFTDPPAAGDYYIIKIQGPQDSIVSYSDFCVNSPDASVETNASGVVDVNTCLDNKGIFLRDALFNGRQKEIKFYASSAAIQPVFNGFDSVFAHIELLHVTEAYFRFEKSARIASDVNGNPFAEPVNVFSNVTNGLGIFSVISLDEQPIR